MSDVHKCCGQPCATAFCPHCGSPGEYGELHELLRHCESKRKHFAKWEIAWRESVNDFPNQKESRIDKSVRAGKHKEKWTRLADAVRKTMKGTA